MSQPDYLLDDAVPSEERRRLQLLSEIANPATIERLASFGSLAGLRVADIGAGDGSIAAWMAGQVGSAGRVVATDLDPQRIPPADRVERRRVVLGRGDLEAGAFDLVHARSVLLHVGDPMAAIDEMVSALRPGGVLLVEDSDLTTFGALDERHPRAGDFDRAMAQLPAWLAGAGVHVTIGRRLPAMLDGTSLVNVEWAVRLLVFRGASRGAELWAWNVENLLTRRPGAERPSMAGTFAALADPTFWFASTTRYQVWGRKPA